MIGLIVVGLSIGLSGSAAAQPAETGAEQRNQDSATGFVDVDASDLAGSGTAADPYVITNASELQAIEDDPDAHYVLGNDIDASATTEWNDGTGFTPINRFNGTLDGSGNVIEGLTIDRPSETGGGLVNVLEDNGKLIDVHLEGVRLVGYYNIGGLVGGTNHGAISNSSVDGSITATGNEAGGLVANNDGVVTGSNFSGEVTGSYGVGGITGDNRQGGVIRGSYAIGNVIANNNNVGGIAGANGGIIRNSAATATVQGNLTDGFNAGGIVGVNGKTNTDGEIETSYATGSVEGDTYVGGVVGQNYNGTIVESYAAGSVEGTFAGGLVGRNDGTVTRSYWDVDATGQADSPGGATGLNTAQMTGSAAETNMTDFTFGDEWQTTSGNYPTLIGVSIDPTEADVPADTVYEPGSTAAEYDDDSNGEISLRELASAASDYSADRLSLRELSNVATAFSASP